MATQEYSKDTFTEILSDLLGWNIGNKVQYSDALEELWDAYDTNYKNEQVDPGFIPQLVIGKKDASGKELTPLFNKEFAGYINLVQKNTGKALGITSLTDYVNARSSYRQILDNFQLGVLATNENIDKFLENNVSASEAANRMQSAYNSVKFADANLKSQLGSLNLSDTDLAKALLLGKEGAAELDMKIKEANIRAAQIDAGLQSTMDVGDLARQGLDRTTVARGLAATKKELGAYQRAATRSGEDAATIQTELERENILGMASQRRAKVAIQERNIFSGQSGTSSQIGLKKRSVGKI